MHALSLHIPSSSSLNSYNSCPQRFIFSCILVVVLNSYNQIITSSIWLVQTSLIDLVSLLFSSDSFNLIFEITFSLVNSCLSCETLAIPLIHLILFPKLLVLASFHIACSSDDRLWFGYLAQFAVGYLAWFAVFGLSCLVVSDIPYVLFGHQAVSCQYIVVLG